MIEGVKIDRPELLKTLKTEAMKGHLLVVGEPGVGKTYLLELLAQDFIDSGSEIYFIEADHYNASSTSELYESMKLPGELHEALLDLEGKEKAFLFIDGLDAARSERTQIVFRELIRSVIAKATNWVVVAGIRRYDALKSREIRLLFGSNDPQTAQFANPLIQQHHILIPSLSSSELQQAAAQVTELRTLLEKSRSEFVQLLTVPRNIEFAVRLLKDKCPLDKLSGIQSEVQLMHVLWDHYVLSEPFGEQKRKVIKAAARRMFDKRSLAVDRTELMGVGSADGLKELLHHSILKELSPSSDFISFDNHTLFDFAVSRHLIPEDSTGSFLEFVKIRENQVFFNPSVRYFLAFQWFYRRAFLWDVVEAFSESNDLNSSVKAMPFVTIADETLQPGDVAGLIDLLKKGKSRGRIIYYFLISVSRHVKSRTQPATWWIQILGDLAAFLDAQSWWLFVEVLSWFGDKGRIGRLKESPEDLSALASCARELLRKGWEIGKPSVESLNARRIISLVCLTYDTDKKASRDLLSHVLSRLGDPKVSVDEIYWLCEGVTEVIRHDPEFAVEIYSKVFGYEEKSDEKIAKGGFVLSLVTTRKQDYHMSQYLLQKAFEQFLSINPVPATRALIRSVEGHIENRERQPNEDIPVINENGINYCIDFSYIWDSNRSYEEDARKMMTQFEDWLGSAEDRNLVEQVFAEVVSSNRQAAIWRRLLFTVAKNPTTLLSVGLHLLTTKAILIGRDTHYAATQALQAVFPILVEKQRAQVERAILELSEYEASWEFIKERMREAVAGKQAELVGVVPADLIVTPELKQLREKLDSQKKLAKPQPPYEESDFEITPHIEKEWLKEQGVAVDKRENAKLIEIHNAMRIVNGIFDDKGKPFEAIEATWKRASELWIEYNELAPKGDERARESGMTTLAEYASNVTRYHALDLSSEFGKFIRDIVNASIADPEPRYDPKYHATLTTPHWSPAPRIEGVKSVLHLLMSGKIQIGEVRDTLIAFSRDEVPIIRFFIARNLPWMYRLDSLLFWALVESILKIESKATVAVLTTFLHSLQALMNEQDVRSKTPDLVNQILRTLGSEELDREISQVAFDVLTELHILHDDPKAKVILDESLASGLGASRAAFHMIRSAFPTTIIGIASQAQKRDQADATRQRGIKFIFFILDYMANQIDFIHKNRSTVKQDDVREFYGLVDAFGDHFYLDVDWGHEHQRKDTTPFLEEERRRYFAEVAKPILNKLVEVCDPAKDSGIPAGTAHNLLELAPSLMKIDFKEVLNIVHGIVHASKPSGYPLDSFAMRDLEAFVSVCLADHRPTLRDDPEALRLLTDMLDVFVEVGWSEALGLVLRLDQVFV